MILGHQAIAQGNDRWAKCVLMTRGSRKVKTKVTRSSLVETGHDLLKLPGVSRLAAIARMSVGRWPGAGDGHPLLLAAAELIRRC